ncbi:hypothetical protein [Nakamurella endophytica]|uniref:Uncharacterized protein n=1 Tax=Nakamurella endophytica TaxID=1748367 RepID=A0A917SU39_9ACTN|nr:hypothetical protein [Nakamurella endophytica]GGL97944.1 hypothetical protein GCM10011594_17270 [Nakamurella endophytica]
MLRFDGAIAGMGTAEGTRFVVGLWPRSPFGLLVDMMVERRDGHRVLLAPTGAAAGFIAATYRFDEVRVGPTTVTIRGARWTVTGPDLELQWTVGRRPLLGLLLRAVPRPLARARWWATVLDPIARRILPGVRTRGTAGNDRREWYGALDLHRIIELSGRFEGRDLGELRPVEPPVRFGFGSTPTAPSLTRVVSTVAGRRGGADPVVGGADGTDAAGSADGTADETPDGTADEARNGTPDGTADGSTGRGGPVRG